MQWKNKIAYNLQELKPSGIRKFFDIVANRKECISLGVGEPDFITPEIILGASIQAIRRGYTHYTSNNGLLSLRRKINTYQEKEFDISYNPENEIIITVGVSQALDIAIRSISNPGDIIFYVEPSYVSYKPVIRLAGATPYAIPVNQKNKFKLTARVLEKHIQSVDHTKCKAIILNYPSNPTGASFTKQELQELAKVIYKYDLLVIADEIYRELTFDMKHTSCATLPELFNRTVVLAGFSKSFAMTGWRIGYICGPKNWVSAILKIHQYTMLCASSISQFAAEAALEEGIEDKQSMFNEYKKRRDFIVKAFNSLGCKTLKPEGAFYIYPNISKHNISSVDFATNLLEEQNVAVVPGTAFGDNGESFIRCSFATSLEELEIALEHIQTFLVKKNN